MINAKSILPLCLFQRKWPSAEPKTTDESYRFPNELERKIENDLKIQDNKIKECKVEIEREIEAGNDGLYESDLSPNQTRLKIEDAGGTNDFVTPSSQRNEASSTRFAHIEIPV